MNAKGNDLDNGQLDEALLTAYALEQLDGAERALVEAALVHSPEARRTVEEVRTLAGHVLQAARADCPYGPSAALREEVAQRLRDPDAAPAEVILPGILRPRRRWLWLSVAAAACLLLVAVPTARLLDRNGPARHGQVALDWSADEATAPMSKPDQTFGRVTEESVTEESVDELAEVADKSVGLVAADSLKDDSGRVGDRVEFKAAAAPVDAMAVAPAARKAPAAKKAPDVRMSKSMPAKRGPPREALSRTVQPGKGAGGQPDLKSRRLATPMFEAEVGDFAAMQQRGQRRKETPALNEPSVATRQHTGYPVADLERSESSGSGRADNDRDQSGYGGGMGGGMMGSGMMGELPEGAAQAAVPPAQPAPNALADGRTDSGVWVLRTRVRSPRLLIEEEEQYAEDRSRELADAEIPGTEQYEALPENTFQLPAEQPQSTFSIDVDTASYANSRRFLQQGRLPPPEAVRVEEFVNYFRYDYPQPKDDVPFSVDLEAAECPWNGENRLVRVGLKGRDVHVAERGPSNLVFLLDVSGSMRDANKLPLVKDAMTMLVDQLTEDDSVSIVTYAGEAGIALKPTRGNQRGEIQQRIEALSAGGSTHGSAGIEVAYEQARLNYQRKGTNRVLLCTDGDLNVGVTDDDELVELIREEAAGGVFLTVLGFGTGNLKDAKLEKMADKGNGIYAYVDSLREARRLMVEQASGSLVTIAKDVKLQVEFNPAEVASYRLIGYENRLMAAEDFDDDSKDAGEIGAGHTVTALYEIVPRDKKTPLRGHGSGGELRYQRAADRELTAAALGGELLTLKLRYKLPDEDQSRLLEFNLTDTGKRFGQASEEFRFAASVAAFGMLLRGSRHTGDLTLSAVEELAAGAVGSDPVGLRREFVKLVRQARTQRGG